MGADVRLLLDYGIALSSRAWLRLGGRTSTYVLEGTMLGLNAFTLLIVAYVTLSLHQRLRMYNPIQQSGLLFILALVALGLSHWLRVISGQIEPVDSMYLLAAFSSAAIWPALFSLLRSLRRGFINN